MRAPSVTSLAVGMLLGMAGSLSAQAWDSPSFMPPRPGEDIGAYFILVPSEATSGIRGERDWGVVGIWRQAGNLNLGVRVGVVTADLPADQSETIILVGGETYGLLSGGATPSSLAFGWSLGLGAAFNEGTFFRVPAGLSISTRLGSGGTALVPYVHPKLALEVAANDDETFTDVTLTPDFGVDILLGGAFKLRLGGAVSYVLTGDTPDEGKLTFGGGIAINFARGVSVSN